LHSFILIALIFFEIIKYNMQKLIFMLKLDINNKEMLLQLSLKIEIRNIIINCKKTIIVIVVKSVRSEIQYSYY